MEKDYLIDKWLNHQLSEAEMQELQQREDYEELEAIVEHARLFRASSFSEPETYQALRDQISAKVQDNAGQAWFRPFLRIAAVLLVGVGLFYLLFKDNTVTVSTLAGEQKRIELPDASIVMINASSEIQYNPDRWENERLVLLNGEAFFDVEKGSTFRVSSPGGTVSVLGTEFNIRQRKGQFEVDCFEGSVEVISAGHLNVLAAGDHFYLIGDQLDLGKNTAEGPSWMNDQSSFSRVPLSMVIEELERQYGINVGYKGVQADNLFTGVFVHGELEEALSAITRPFNLSYRIDSADQVTIYSREN